MSRLRDCIRRLNASEEKALGVFVTAGYPTLRDSLPVLNALDTGGADFIELGMPFSDPLAEGLPIQMSSAVALNNGVTMEYTFETAAAFRSGSDTPLVLMGYVNPILRFGISNFFERCRSSGVDAVILPDYPLHSRLSIRDAAAQCGVDLVNLVAPTTSADRIREIDNISDGFVYAVSMTGLTGNAIPDKSVIRGYLETVTGLCTKNPVLIGFGISTARDVADLSDGADGCIVGSAIIKQLEELWSDSNHSTTERLGLLSAFVSDLKSGTT